VLGRARRDRRDRRAGPEPGRRDRRGQVPGRRRPLAAAPRRPGQHRPAARPGLLARLAGQPLDTLLPHPAAGARGPDPVTPASPAGADPANADPATPGAPADPGPATPASPGSWPAGLGGAGGLTGTVNLAMPATTWLGLTDNPGQAGGHGAIDAGTCRDLGAALAARGDSRWCLTLTDRDGRAVAHGCARAGPGPPGAGDPAAWLARITLTPIATGTCAHRRQTAGYRPPDSPRHLIKTRSPRCGYPGCRRPATGCDDDHTIPHHHGGRTCECNLALAYIS